MSDGRGPVGEGALNGTKPELIDLTGELPTDRARVELSLTVGQARLSVQAQRSRLWLRIFKALALLLLLGIGSYAAFQSVPDALPLAASLAALTGSLAGIAASWIAIRAQKRDLESIETIQRVIKPSLDSIRKSGYLE